MVNWRLPVMLCCLSALLTGAFYWQKSQWNQERKEQYARLAWILRRGDDEARLSPPRRAYLAGKFEECLRLLEQPENAADRELQSSALLALLYEVPWPEQVLHHEQIEAAKSRPRLLARVVQTGYAEDAGKVRVDLLVWKSGRLDKLNPPARKSLARDQDWKEVEELSLVHLDRKDEHLSQLCISGRSRDGHNRLDVIYGTSEWKRWTLIDSKKLKRLGDRIAVEKGSGYKLIEDEWIEVKP